MDDPRMENRGWRTDIGEQRIEDGERNQGRCYLTVSLQLCDPGLLPLPQPGGLHLLPVRELLSGSREGGTETCRGREDKVREGVVEVHIGSMHDYYLEPEKLKTIEEKKRG